MDAAAELGRNSVSKHQIQPEYGDEQADAGRLNPSRETKFSGTYGDRIFPVQLTTSRIGNLTRLIHTLLYVMAMHTYILPRVRRHTPSKPQGIFERVLPWQVTLDQLICSLSHTHFWYEVGILKVPARTRVIQKISELCGSTR